MLNLDLNALAVESFDVHSHPSQWASAADDEEGVTVGMGYSHDVTQPHVCRTATTTF